MIWHKHFRCAHHGFRKLFRLLNLAREDQPPNLFDLTVGRRAGVVVWNTTPQSALVDLQAFICGTAKLLAGRGIKIHHIFYWSDAFRNPDIENTQVQVRYDPFEVGVAYAFIGKRWVTCHSEYYSVFHGRSEKELMIATKELRALKNSHSQQFTVTAKKLADFLESVEAEEVMLVQRLRDMEGRKVFEKINNVAVSAGAAEVALLESTNEPVETP
ncbi:MAG TPA: hypothetical protein DCK99_10370, partial [Blastocatellia bacterium]|nr:hypothetical protein [Blastocatellia bacterium]